LAEFHNATHEGFHKIFQRVKAVFFFKGLKN